MLCACSPADQPITSQHSREAASESAGRSEPGGGARSQEAAPLDLSREHLQALTDAQPEPGELPPALPQMFDDTPERGVRLEPALITNKEASTLQDTIDGVELKIEIERP